MGRFLIYGIKINSLDLTPKGTNDFPYTFKLAMGNGNTISDTCAAELFPLKDHVHNLLLVLYEVCLFQGTESAPG